ncbi:MAG: ribonuclease III [Dehalococcoidia bacterium]
MEDITELKNTLQVPFREPVLLQQALVHRSYLNENPDFELQSNERLEFLGDSMLGVVIAEKLYREHRDLPEGDLTKLRSALVRRETLARIARQRLKLDNYIYLGRGEESNSGRARQSILADALEAVIGAVFLDQGFDACRDLILRLYDGEIEKAADTVLNADFKSRLQEIVQSRCREVPEYRVISAEGPDHAREFIVEVLIGGRVLGKGKGSSKREAEQGAARAALEAGP